MSSFAQRRGLPSFEEAEGLGPADLPFVLDLIAVLDRHGNLDRFGLCLLHDHFKLAPDEILVETNDAQRRTLTVSVEKADQTTHTKASQWRFLPSVPSAERAEYENEPYEVVLACDCHPMPPPF